MQLKLSKCTVASLNKIAIFANNTNTKIKNKKSFICPGFFLVRKNEQNIELTFYPCIQSVYSVQCFLEL